MEILAKAIPESQTSVKIGNDSGLKSVDDPILPGCPKKGKRPKKVFDRYWRMPPSKCRQKPCQKTRKMSKFGNDAGLKPIDDLMYPSTQWRERPDVLPVRLSGSGVFPQAPGLDLRRTILAPDGGNSQMCCPCDFQGGLSSSSRLGS